MRTGMIGIITSLIEETECDAAVGSRLGFSAGGYLSLADIRSGESWGRVWASKLSFKLHVVIKPLDLFY